MLEEKDLQHIKDRIPERWGKWISVLPGWYQLIYDLDRQIAEIDPDYVIHQVKQKFGGLRFYIETSDGVGYAGPIVDLIRAAEDKAMRTCEYCGEDGDVDPKSRSWMQITCAKHQGARPE